MLHPSSLMYEVRMLLPSPNSTSKGTHMPRFYLGLPRTKPVPPTPSVAGQGVNLQQTLVYASLNRPEVNPETVLGKLKKTYLCVRVCPVSTGYFYKTTQHRGGFM